jgi:hypothetical protein
MNIAKYLQDRPDGFTLKGEWRQGSAVAFVEYWNDEAYLTLPLWAIKIEGAKFWLKDNCFGMCLTALRSSGVLDTMPQHFGFLTKELYGDGLYVFYDRRNGKYFHTISIPVERLRYVSMKCFLCFQKYCFVHIFN